MESHRANDRQEEGHPVANIKSQKKRILTNAKAAERNKSVRSELKSRMKSAVNSIGEDGSDEKVSAAIKKIDMAAQKGVIHKNAAARQKSRLMKKVNAQA
jgi:small subunit ribosomal protein S20